MKATPGPAAKAVYSEVTSPDPTTVLCIWQRLRPAGEKDRFVMKKREMASGVPGPQAVVTGNCNWGAC